MLLEDMFVKACYAAIWPIGFLFSKIFFTIKIVGKEKLKGLKGPLIVAMNHSSAYDIMVMAAFPPILRITPFHFAAAPKFFWRFLPFMLAMGCFPVKRGIGLDKSLKPALRILKKGGVIGIFPQGSRIKEGERLKGKRGAPFSAIKTKTPILPVYIGGLVGLGNAGIFKEKRNMKIIIGDPFTLEPVDMDNPENLNTPANFIMQKIYELENR